MFKLASWNVNSIKVRLQHVLDWIESSKVDILALQETKLMDEHFPVDVFKERGYFIEFSGQKTYNGVALISRYPMKEVVRDIPALEDIQRRILVATIGDLRLINLYVPNGSDLASDKYQYKLSWLEKITEFIKQQMEVYSKLAVVGDFNIAPEDIDVHDPEEWEGQVLVSPKEREAFSEILSLGLIDSFRALHPQLQRFSWWDYRAGGFRRNRGLRIDHVLLSHELRANCIESEIDIEPRRWDRPSDHAPVWVKLKDENLSLSS
ncbi:exodeoxyribonuclease III [Legionella israelensis]|uniref:Endonuclease/exonuclease/phosphatase domain-containing protein n=1 Tax=Legionella israelensis TaxID=454 RepID=A0A0W0WIC3_9GAMM|nr:exodeoxyribonuclease III [Legionella israelensis]KTD32116.1 hypothetical protein Lisr_0439 [Legionella israelensis]QBS10237.1 exodeoxyribonuclease III [Legionella israelensis]SCY20870.1 Exodeoxyribonuclease III [Legionella israelensis DSM 19235]STX59830.1 exodeoxyribonuclease III [Legionella israelensis]